MSLSNSVINSRGSKKRALRSKRHRPEKCEPCNESLDSEDMDVDHLELPLQVQGSETGSAAAAGLHSCSSCDKTLDSEDLNDVELPTNSEEESALELESDQQNMESPTEYATVQDQEEEEGRLVAEGDGDEVPEEEETADASADGEGELYDAHEIVPVIGQHYKMRGGKKVDCETCFYKKRGDINQSRATPEAVRYDTVLVDGEGNEVIQTTPQIGQHYFVVMKEKIPCQKCYPLQGPKRTVKQLKKVKHIEVSVLVPQMNSESDRSLSREKDSRESATKDFNSLMFQVEEHIERPEFLQTFTEQEETCPTEYTLREGYGESCNSDCYSDCYSEPEPKSSESEDKEKPGELDEAFLEHAFDHSSNATTGTEKPTESAEEPPSKKGGSAEVHPHAPYMRVATKRGAGGRAQDLVQRDPERRGKRQLYMYQGKSPEEFVSGHHKVYFSNVGLDMQEKKDVEEAAREAYLLSRELTSANFDTTPHVSSMLKATLFEHKHARENKCT